MEMQLVYGLCNYDDDAKSYLRKISSAGLVTNPKDQYVSQEMRKGAISL